MRGTRPQTFTIFTITHKVVVYAPAERADTPTLFHLYVLCSLHGPANLKIKSTRRTVLTPFEFFLSAWFMDQYTPGKCMCRAHKKKELNNFTLLSLVRCLSIHAIKSLTWILRCCPIHAIKLLNFDSRVLVWKC